MERHTSLYLDMLRFGAAAIVFFAHFASQRYSGGLFWPIERFGGQAVMIFFVLSGYVIAYTAEERDRTPRLFLCNRLARMYSVVVPALILTLVADQIGLALAPQLYSPSWGFENDQPVAQSLLMLTFATQFWGIHVQPFSDGPFWSLSYEFWYYVLFAALTFVGGAKRLLAFGAGALLVGAPILLLLPVWWLGVALYRWTREHRIPTAWGWVLFTGSFAAFAALQFVPGRGGLNPWFRDHVWPYIGRQYFPPINFIFDWLLGIVVAANIAGFNAIGHQFAPLLQRLKKPIRFFAGLTFSLYLYHMPLLQVGSAVYGDQPNSWGQRAFLLACVPFSVWLLGSVTERKKDTARLMIQYADSWLSAGFSRIAAHAWAAEPRGGGPA